MAHYHHQLKKSILNETEDIEDDKFLKEVKSKWVEGDRQNLAICLAGYLRKKKRMGTQQRNHNRAKDL